MRLDIEADLITCAFDSINYLLNKEDLVDAFVTINQHLKPFGIFFFDVNTPTHYMAKGSGVIERDIDGVEFKQILEYDEEKEIAKITFDFQDDLNEEHIQRAYTLGEITSYLNKSGFKVMEVFQDFELTPPKEESDRIFFFAQKIDNGL